ncbi:MAG: twin-arginine translocation signal domain-containing protein, partial [Tannerella sp.]|nr:twin-arginine translocation signal domain-containing protein [Tannerella sp.]
MTNRRQFLKQSSLLVAGGLMGSLTVGGCSQTVSLKLKTGEILTLDRKSNEFLFLRNVKDGRVVPLPVGKFRKNGTACTEI